MRHFPILALLVAASVLVAACGSDKNAEAAAETENATTAMPAADGQAPSTATTENQPVQPEVPAGPTTKMTFKYLEYDFGTVKDGEVVRHDYEFTNTGTEPLIIADAKASCGCTVPQWPKEPIQPGGNGKIRVEFDSKGKPGPQSKRVTITANTDPSPIFLTIKGNVEGKTN